ARDLHDTVVQRLFATGLSLQSLVRRAPNSEVAERLEAAVDDLDDTITQIRSTIFALGKERVDRGGLRSEVMTLALGSAPSLGFEPRIELRGEIDSVSDPGLCEHVVAALREALSNIARHARASSAEVIVDVSDTEMLLMVVDDGIGVSGTLPRPGGQGVVNLARRAELLGGEMTLSDLSERGACGTELVWRVPLRVNETPRAKRSLAGP
ncbi:MAG: histidine kinase, partial [Actinomycetota bacterium]|nr:histidine kinase [Actinomycetota bacterium]